MTDVRQRFYIHDCPIRGEVVHLQQTLSTILSQREYPLAIQILLGEMLVASSLLASTLKIQGRLSIQIQGSGSLKWAMAECNHLGELRALAEFTEDDRFATAEDSSIALSSLQNGVLFINIEPDMGERYQGIVPLEHATLAQCLVQYYDLSAQIPTRIVLASDHKTAGGLLIQLLPRTEEEQETIDQDLWPRLTMLTETLKSDELIHLPAEEILYRLYNEEDVRLPEAEQLNFGCTCSKERCANALLQIGAEAVKETLMAQNPIEMNCQFCNAQYRFSAEEALGLFGQHVS
ncbi:Hsp33 family molecular chaperone HslO [Acinetobacter qingfengensis]|uniref:33 kDa chaperonin n=1 Tax=Acinetobacter qingfengensis TaxID=1262585 RepID=A0A1E7R9U7_9GAMM|nr:Hsp33 family molecular chaperone HslO [Acinetobacter qingfengensis]KAA8733922.1 Hsp33 family molecular chaperone HslO [Acinetobacter qingfengensis]OEY96159.1 heat-shock protein Hsp33 [Acinetobacter qingfengensis]